MANELTPPEPLSPPMSLTAPAPIKPVPKTQAAGMVPLDDSTQEKLQNRAVAFVEEVILLPVNSEPFLEKVKAIHEMGGEDIRDAAAVSNRMLQRPIRSMESGVLDESSTVSRSLLDLRKTIEDLDPSRQGDLFSTRKLLGVVPLGNKVRDYFLKYQSAQGHINTIIETLYRSQDELRMDNAAIEQEKVNLWENMQKLQQYIFLGTHIDTALEERIAELEVADAAKARVVREEMLFYVRQKNQDLLTQLAVSIQGYLALDLIRKNNLELIKGVDRATTTTVSALRTAVLVAQALANQKLVLDQINALNTTTGNLIESTSAMLKGQTADVHKQASSATVNVEQLQTAFDNIYETIDMISTYKTEALDSMRSTVNTLAAEIDRANAYLDRVQQRELAAATAGLQVPAENEITELKRQEKASTDLTL